MAVEVPVAAVQAVALVVRPAAEQAAAWAQAGGPVVQAAAVVRAAALAVVPVKLAVPAVCAVVPGKPVAGCAVEPAVVPLARASPARPVGPAVANAVVPAEAAKMERAAVAKTVARPSAVAIATVGPNGVTAATATAAWIAMDGVTAVVAAAVATGVPHAAPSGVLALLNAPSSGRTCSAAPCRGSPPAPLR